MRLVTLVALALTLLGGLRAVPVRAQEATPPPGAEVPPADACTVEPPTPAEIVAILATPGPAAEASPAGGLPPSGGSLTVASEAEFPSGAPADAATTEAVAAVMRQLIACSNAGEDVRLIALISDALVRAILAGEELPTEAELAEEMATPPVPDAEPTAILALRDARVLADGRVGIVLVDDTLTDEEGPSTAMFILMNAGGRWLLDAAIRVEPDEE